MDEREFRARLLTVRIIWAAMLMGIAVFAGVVITVGRNHPPSNPLLPNLLLYIAIAMAAACIPAGFVIRSILWNKGRDQSGAVAPPAYVSGNIISWAMCEAPTLVALLGAMINGGRGPHLIVAGITTAILASAFPTGTQMRGAN
jgi:hypothetical protein